MVTCKQFLQDLNDFLDETMDAGLRAELERHVTECPNCWVVFSTTEKTLKVFKGMEPQNVPPAVEAKLMRALQEKMRAKAERTAKKADA